MATHISWCLPWLRLFRRASALRGRNLGVISREIVMKRIEQGSKTKDILYHLVSHSSLNARDSILMTYCRLTRRVFNLKNPPFPSSSPMRFVIQHKSNPILTAMAHTGISDDSGIWHNIFSAKRHLVFPTERSCGSGTRSSGSRLGFPRKRYVRFCQDEWFAFCKCCYVSYFRLRLGMSV